MGMRLDIWRITMKDDERTAQLMQMMITRWVDMKTTKCFMSWLSLVRRRINEIAVVKRAVKSWMQPQVLHVFTTLRSVAADVKRVRQICMRSVKRWTRRSLAAAFDFWRVRCEEDIIQKRMLKNSIQKMMKQTLNRAYKSMKQHASAIRRRRKWKEEQMLQWSANSAQMLRRVVWKLVKGEIGMRLYLWRENITKLRLNDHNKLQAALSHVNGNHGAARLRLIFWRQVKGVVATSVDIWRACMNAEYTALRRAATRWHQRFTSKTLFEWLSQTRLMRQEKHALRTAILRWTQRRLWQVFSTFRNIAAMLKRTAAVATKATQRWRNQKLTSALRYWITSYQTFFTQKKIVNNVVGCIRLREQRRAYRTLQYFSSGKKMNTKRISQATRRLRSVILRCVKGEIGLSMDNWRRSTKDEVDAGIQRRLKKQLFLQNENAREELQIQLKDAMAQEALRQLRQVIWRLMRGEVGMRLHTWRVSKQESVIQTMMQADFEKACFIHQKALRQLRQVTWRLVKGDVGMRLDIWRMAKRDEFALMKDLEYNRSTQALEEAASQEIVGMRLDIWRMSRIVEEVQGVKDDVDLVKHSSQRHMRNAFWKVKGDIAMKMDAWVGNNGVMNDKTGYNDVKYDKTGYNDVKYDKTGYNDVKYDKIGYEDIQYESYENAAYSEANATYGSAGLPDMQQAIADMQQTIGSLHSPPRRQDGTNISAVRRTESAPAFRDPSHEGMVSPDLGTLNVDTTLKLKMLQKELLKTQELMLSTPRAGQGRELLSMHADDIEQKIKALLVGFTPRGGKRPVATEPKPVPRLNMEMVNPSGIAGVFMEEGCRDEQGFLID